MEKFPGRRLCPTLVDCIIVPPEKCLRENLIINISDAARYEYIHINLIVCLQFGPLSYFPFYALKMISILYRLRGKGAS